MSLFFAIVPWFLVVGALPFLLRQRPDLVDYPAGLTDAPGPRPLVSVIVTTRNDARRIGPCLATLLDSRYRPYEVVVVDSGSGDGTREIVEALEKRSPERVKLLDAGPVEGDRSWRQWACWMGYQAARGELLVFTRPGTLHEDELLGRAVSALDREGADLVSVYPRLTMRGFWERLVMPHVWVILTARLPTPRAVNRGQDAIDAVASPHFLLFRREAYEAVGGHGALRPLDPSSAVLARAVLAAGRKVFLVHGERYLESRTYRSFWRLADELGSDVPALWSAGVPRRAVWLTSWLVALMPVLFFVVPPAVLLGVTLGLLSGTAAPWAFWATALSLGFWLVVYARHRIRPAYAVAYPVGAAVSAFIVVRGLVKAIARERVHERHHLREDRTG
jgi:chlorobactene glucosyltransferase